MEPKGSYVVVGLFVLLVGVAMVASLFWLAGWGRGSEKLYHVLMKESVSGLAADAAVKYRGVDVGRVVALDLRPDDPEIVQITLGVDPSTPVLVDTKAQLEFQGVTGLAFVNLIGGTRGAARLEAKPGEELPVIESAPSILTRLDAGVSTLLVSVTKTSEELNDILAAVDREQLARAVANLDRLSQTLADSSANLGGVIANAERFLDSAARASERVPGLVERIDGLTAEWHETSREIRDRTGRSADGLDKMTDEVSGNVQLLAGDLRQLVNRLEQVVMELEEDPSMFLYGRTPARKGPGE